MFYAISFVLVTSIICTLTIDAVHRYACDEPQRKVYRFFSILVFVVVFSGCGIEPVHTVYDTNVQVSLSDSGKATVHISNSNGTFGSEYIELHTVQVPQKALQSGPNDVANYIGAEMNRRTTVLDSAPIRFHGSAYREITQDIMYR